MNKLENKGVNAPQARLWGIPNCDTVKRARAFLAQHGIEAEFTDFKKAGVDAQALQAWMLALGWERLLNRQGRTWRQLTPDEQAQVCDAASAARLMQAQPSVIRRPVVQWPQGDMTVGFEPSKWQERLSGAQEGA
jgi:arsenate reductase